jgi:hypothetical protein
MSDYLKITEDERNDAVCAGALVEAIGTVLCHAPSFVFTDGKAFYQGLGTMLGEVGLDLRASMGNVEQRSIDERRETRAVKAP